MLADRDYMREPEWRASSWSLTTILLVANTVIFVLQSVVQFYVPAFPLGAYFGLSVGGLLHGFFWQPITFQFMHSGLLHLLGNLIAIYFFGRSIEATLGRAGFLSIYFSSGTVGGLLQLLASVLWPQHFGQGGVVGASAGAFGLIAAFAALYPERPLTLLLFFVIPLSLRAKFLLLFEVLLALFGILVPTDNIAHVAHLGGILMGLAFVRWKDRPDWVSILPRRAKARLRPRELTEAKVIKGPWRTPKDGSEELPPSEFISREVDPILDKISAHGIHSLTPQERRILEAASARIGND